MRTVPPSFRESDNNETAFSCCREICDDWLIFDENGKILALRTDRIELRRAVSFESLIDERDRAFFASFRPGYSRCRILLTVSGHATLILDDFYPATRLRIAVILRMPVSALPFLYRHFSGEELITAPSLPRPAEEINEVSPAVERFTAAVGNAFFLPSYIPDPIAYLGVFLKLLTDHVRAIAYFLGLGTEGHVPDILDLSDAFLFSFPGFIVLTSLVFCAVRQTAEDHFAEFRISVRDGRLLFDVICLCAEEKIRSTSFEVCRQFAGRGYEYAFDISDIGDGRIRIRYSTDIPDASVFGLKTRVTSEQ